MANTELDEMPFFNLTDSALHESLECDKWMSVFNNEELKNYILKINKSETFRELNFN